MLKALFSLAIAAAAWLTASVASADYAAIAYSESTGNYGYSYNYAYLPSAEAEALVNCNATDAKVVVWCVNNWCALAVGDNGAYGWGYYTTELGAEAEALANCAQYGTNAHIACIVFSGF